MSSAAPAVTVILPVYNGARYLRYAGESVLDQGHPAVEILVVDDGSTDDSPDVLRGLTGAMRTIRQENRGPAAARNHGIRLARTEVLAFVDADDLWPAGKLERQLPLLAADPSVDLVMGYTQPMRMLSPGGDIAALEPVLSPRLTLSVGASLFRRSAFERFGLFDESLRTGEDLDWLLRAREAGARIELVNAVTLLYRENPGSLTHGKDPAQLAFFRVLKRSLERRRAGGTALAPIRERPDGG
jgi:glycosyltransferase involved in cell wall biosynthesis